MIPADKQKSLKKKISKGYPIGELKEELLADGFSLEEINECIGVGKADMRSWYLFFGASFFILGIWIIMNNGNYILMVAGCILLMLFLKENKN
jgi:hypothetical protein